MTPLATAIQSLGLSSKEAEIRTALNADVDAAAGAAGGVAGIPALSVNVLHCYSIK